MKEIKQNDILKVLDSQVKKDFKDYFQDRDYGVIGITKEDAIRGFCVKIKNALKEAQKRHNLSPAATVVLGRAMAAALLLTSLLKHATNQRLLLRIDCNGPVKGIVVEADAKGNVRGYVLNPNLPTLIKEENGQKKFDIKSLIGQGYLTVVKDYGLKTPYESTVPLVSGEIAQDVAYYLAKSEQIPSAVSLGVKINEEGEVIAAGGLLVQVLPGAEEKTISKIEENVKKLPPISKLFEEGKRPEDILELAFAGYTPAILALKEIKYSCKCNKDLAKSILLSLPLDELEKLIKEGKANIRCHFCGKEYTFTKEELEEILKEKKEKCSCSKEGAKKILKEFPKEEIEKGIEKGYLEVMCPKCGKTYKFDKEELKKMLKN